MSQINVLCGGFGWTALSGVWREWEHSVPSLLLLLSVVYGSQTVTSSDLVSHLFCLLWTSSSRFAVPFFVNILGDTPNVHS